MADMQFAKVGKYYQLRYFLIMRKMINVVCTECDAMQLVHALCQPTEVWQVEVTEQNYTLDRPVSVDKIELYSSGVFD